MIAWSLIFTLGGFSPIAPTSTMRWKSARRQRRHLGRDPAAKAEAPRRLARLDPELSQEPLIERGDVARMAQPWGARSDFSPKPGMGSANDHIETCAASRLVRTGNLSRVPMSWCRTSTGRRCRRARPVTANAAQIDVPAHSTRPSPLPSLH